MEKHYHHLGGSGGYGLGYNLPAAVGAALANRAHGPLLRQPAARRRLHVRAGRAVDRGASPDPAAHRHAQQPRLSSGGHARAAHVQPAQPRREPGQDAGPDRHLDRGAGYRLREDGRRRWAGGRPARSRIRPSSAPTLKRAHRGGEVRRAGAGRRRGRSRAEDGHHAQHSRHGRTGGARRRPRRSARPSPSRRPPTKGKPPSCKYGCWQCHGTLGQGGVTGPKLAPDPMP